MRRGITYQFLLVFLLLFPLSELVAQISMTASPTTYTQDFDGLNNNSPGTNVTWADNTTVPGWYTNGQTTYRTYSTGDAAPSNRIWSCGSAAGNTERALGSIMTSTTVRSWGVQLKNTSGNTLTSLTIGFDAERWYTLGTGANFLVQYSTSVTSIGDAIASSNWTSLATISSPATGLSYDLSSLNLANNATITIRFIASYSGSSSNVSLWATDNFTASWSAGAASPTITVGSITAFGNQVANTTSAEKTYNVSGSNLTNNISITPPTNFEISTGTGGSFVATNPITLTQSGGTVSSTPIYVRYKPSSATGATGSLNITHASTGATSQNVAVSGNAIASEPGSIGSLSFGTTNNTSIIVNLPTIGDGTNRIIVVKSGSSPTAPADASDYTANSAFGSGSTTGAGSYVVYNGTGSGAGVVTVTGLSAGTTYYFGVYEYNVGTGTSQNYLTSSSASANQSTTAPTYTWTGATDNSFATATNWSPDRSSPTTSDILQFNGATATITAFTTQQVAQLVITGNSNITLQSASAQTLTIGSSMSIASGSTFIQGSTVSVTMAANSTSTISGTYELVAGTFTTTASGVVVSIDGASAVLKNSGGTITSSATTLLFKNNASFRHAANGVAIPTANWTTNGGSTVNITGVTSTSPASSLNQAFNNVIWNCSSQTVAGVVFGTTGLSISGDLTVGSTGTGTIQLTSGSGVAALIVSGNYSQSGGDVFIFATSGRSLTVNGNFELSGGTFSITKNGQGTATSGVALNVKGGYNQTGGTLANTVANSISALTLNGTSSQDITLGTTSAVNITLNNSSGAILLTSAVIPGTLTLTTGMLSIGSNTLSIGGTISRTSGNIGATAGTIELNGSSAQTIPANSFSGNTVANLKISNDVVIGGTLSISDVLSFGNVNNKTLTTNGNLVLASTASGTATVADITNGGVNTGNSISGNVTVERYIPAKRAWRLLTAPLKGSSNNSVYYNWQNNGSSGVVTNTGVEIWGSSGTGLATGANYSLRKYTSANGWVNITNTQTEQLFNSTHNNAFAIFVTGSYGGGNITSGYAATTLKATGTLHVGNVTHSNIDNSKHAMIGNPYASPVNIHNVISGNAAFDQFIWFWDPALGSNGTGGYVTYTVATKLYTASTNYPGGAQDAVAQSGQAFFIKANNPTNTLTFSESNKTTGSSNTVFRTSNTAEVLRTGLYKIINSNALLADAVMNIFTTGSDASVTNDDAVKMSNGGENLSIIRNNSYLSIEYRPTISSNDTIFLTMWNTAAGNYRFRFEAINMSSSGLSAFLEDAYLNTSTPVSLNGNTVEVDFAVTSNAATTGNRFRIVFRPATTLPLAINNIKAFEKGNAIAVEWSNSSETNVERYEVERSADGRNFTKAATVSAKANNGSAVNYQWIDNNPLGSTNYYRIKVLAAGDNKYSSIVKVNLQKGTTYISLYPNPVKGESVQLQLSNLAKGQYTIKMYNSAGQQVYQRSLQHNGGSASETISLGNTLPSGSYVLRLTGTDVDMNQRIIIEKP